MFVSNGLKLIISLKDAYIFYHKFRFSLFIILLLICNVEYTKKRYCDLKKKKSFLPHNGYVDGGEFVVLEPAESKHQGSVRRVIMRIMMMRTEENGDDDDGDGDGDDYDDDYED